MLSSFICYYLITVQAMDTTDTGSTAWVLTAAMTTMLIVPGLSFFYAGSATKKNLLTTISMGFMIFCISTLSWGLVGFSLAFGAPTIASGFVGDCSYCAFRYISDSTSNSFSSKVPFTTYFFLQMIYAGLAPVIFITPAIGRIRTVFLILFTISYQLIVYSPITYWLRSSNGWLNRMGAIDFAGAAPIHLASGVAVLSILYFIGYGEQKQAKSSFSSAFCTLVGTGLLWFGFFGFNGGAALTAGLSASVALTNTQFAAAGGSLGWGIAQYIITDKTKINGWCNGAICGMVSITACAGYVPLWSAAVIGFSAAILAYIFSHIKSASYQQMPDTLGNFAAHGLSAIWGIICAGAFAAVESGSTYQGLFYGGVEGARLFGVNILCVVVVVAYTFTISNAVYFIITKFVEPKVTEEQQEEGLDKYSDIEQSDPLDEQDIVNILRVMNNFQEINQLIQSEPVIDSFKDLLPKESNKLKQNIKTNKKIRGQREREIRVPTHEELIVKAALIHRVKEEQMIENLENNILLKHQLSIK